MLPLAAPSQRRAERGAVWAWAGTERAPDQADARMGSLMGKLREGRSPYLPHPISAREGRSEGECQ